MEVVSKEEMMTLEHLEEAAVAVEEVALVIEEEDSVKEEVDSEKEEEVASVAKEEEAEVAEGEEVSEEHLKTKKKLDLNLIQNSISIGKREESKIKVRFYTHITTNSSI